MFNPSQRSSSNLLGAQGPGIFDRIDVVGESPAFDEGPRPRRRIDASSGSMDTQPVDPYTQGVEITRQARYDAGLVKVWSGDQGHVLRQATFGCGEVGSEHAARADKDRFDPVGYIQAQLVDSPLWWNIITFPIDVSNDAASLDGAIEPLTIRAVASLSSIEAPFESHSVKGSLSGGNYDAVNGSDMVLSVDSLSVRSALGPFMDLIDMFGPLSTVAYLRPEPRRVPPFVDARALRGTTAIDPFDSASIIAALSPMAPSDDGYVGDGQRSCACGWYYDGNPRPGTDSVAFGGMTY